MHLLSCKHPNRIFNKYTNEYVWVPCGKCSICKNRRSAKYSELLERERLQHPISFFVTLTYSNSNIPCLDTGDFCEYDKLHDVEFVSTRKCDNICIPFKQLFPENKFWTGDVDMMPDDCYCQADIDFFERWIDYGGLPIPSKSDAQLFLKRLNKYIHDHVTNTFKNFRYFLVSELGSTTFRPHLHAIFFVDNMRLAERFKDCVSASWKYGLIDCQPVESSACSYCAQYINKSADMPFVYQHKQIRPFFLCSRNPFIGSFSQSSEVDKEIIDKSTVTTFVRKKAGSTTFDVVPLQQSYQNRLFPKCPSYGSVSDNVRTQLYAISNRFPADSLKSFIKQVYYYLSRFQLYHQDGEFGEFLNSKLKFAHISFYWSDPLHWFDKVSFNWLRRLYYFGRKISRQACQYGFSIFAYTHKIFEYYKNKELYLLKSQYEYQQEVAESDCESIALMYPEFLFNLGISISDYIDNIDSRVAKMQIDDADYLYYSNKKTHFKNAYLDSLALKRDSIFLFNILKSYFYAKKCNETLEAFAT